MDTKQTSWLTAAAALLLLVVGCDDSKHPLSGPAHSKPDACLAGVWKHKDDGGNVTYYHIGCVGGKAPEGLMRVVSITHLGNGQIQGPSIMLAFPTHLASNTYLNLTGDQDLKALQEKGWQAEKADSYFLFRYRLEGDTLLLWGMDGDAKRRAIESGKVQGVIEKQKNGPDRILFTDTTENLARFVAQEGEKLLSKEPIRFERVK